MSIAGQGTWVDRTRLLLFPMADRLATEMDDSNYQRLPIPHTFKPRLSFREASVAVFAAFSRIFFGSLLFAIWGSYSLAAILAIRSNVLRVALALPLIALFLLLFGLLMLAIAKMMRALWPKRHLT